jgi:hypothetical protein
MDHSLQIIEEIAVHQKKISTSLTTIKTTQEIIISILKNNVFSRITDSVKNNCNFCNKNALYTDTDNKYYFWFHRSMYEE